MASNSSSVSGTLTVRVEPVERGDAPAAPERAADDLEQPTIPERPIPNFDGRPDDPTTAGDVLLWIPRIAFAPLWVITEFVLRRPLVWLTNVVIRYKVPRRLKEACTQRDHQVQVVTRAMSRPTLSSSSMSSGSATRAFG